MVRNGLRPTKAQRPEFNRLKAKLATLNVSNWARAQCVMDQMSAVCCKAYGPMGGKITCRACSICGYYAHSAANCPVLEKRRQRALDRELARVREDQNLLETMEVDSAWAKKLAEHDRIFKAKVAMGLGCTRKITCASDIDLECRCAGCLRWYAAVVPPPSSDQ